MAKAATTKKVVKKRRERKNIEKGAVHIQTTFNNTIVTISDVNGNAISWASAGELGFKGAVCTDWGVASRGPLNPRLQGKTTLKDNYAMIYNAGVDQIGSETHPEYIVELVREGRIAEDRIGQRPAELGLADARGAAEEERADGTCRVLEPHPSPADGAGDGGHRLVLPDDALL